jgi:aminopeptidase N
MISKKVLALCGAVSLAALSATPVLSAPAAQVTTQLPRTAKPTHYAISFTPDAAKLTFSAEAVIEIEVLKPTNVIVVNAADLAFQNVSIRKIGEVAQEADVALNEKAQTVSFTVKKQLTPGKYQVKARYSGKISQQASGMFALDYKDPTGAEKRALFTQFEAPDARRFVPSWDEPNYKATFDMTATVPTAQMAVSNMPITSRQDRKDGTSVVTFARSPKMSTYLLFFGLGEFDRITKQVGPTEVGVIVGKGNGEKGRYALNASAELVAYYNDYFGVPYPLPKLDNVAGPGQSQFFSAMENWGAIFTFERVLLLDPKITSARGMQRIYQTDAHEIAHQWFGNLVTMQWWDDLWLNEGFASWMESKATAKFNPSWQAELDRVGGREGAMGLDAFATTHPVIQKIETVEQTSQAFDTITYSKGEAVITMLEGFAGENVWRDGIRAYMKKHAYGNTKTDDLWTAVEAAGAKGLVAIAHDFTKKPGVPLIKVTGATCSGGATRLTFAQGEFSRDAKTRADAKPLSWNVPVIAQTIGGASARTIVSGGKGALTVPGCGTVIVNAGQSGYYRVLYTPEMKMTLARDFAKLAPIDQLGLLNDSNALGVANYQSMSVGLDLTSAVPASASQRVIEDVVDTHSALYDRFKDDPVTQAKIAEITTKRFGATLQKLGMKPVQGEALLDSNLRSTLITTLGAMGDPTVVAEAKRLFAALDTDKTALDGPLRTTWLRIVAYNADRPVWDKLRKLGQTADGQVVKTTMYRLLGTAKDKTLAADALKLALTPEPGATVSAEMVSTVANEHPDMAVDFALANLKAVEELVDASSRSEYVGSLAGDSIDPAMPAKLDAYAKANLTPESRKPLDGVIARIKTRIADMPRIKAGITEWLARQ